MAAGRKITIEFLGKDSTSSTTRSVEQRFGKLGTKLDKVGQVAGKALAGGLLIAGTAAVKLSGQASDLAETQSKVAQIFGKDSTAALDDFATKAAKTMGQSKQTALDGAATFGIIGKSAGLAGDDLVGFSTDMVQLAGDMASFNNTSPEDAIEAISAAMRGEAEPIRKYGVLLDDATLKAEAMKMGLIKTTKEALTPQQKALAAQSAILKQTSDQQGDFARTSDGMANKQRVLKAELENMGTALGAKVLPAMLKMVDAGLKISDWVSEHSTLVGILVGVLGTLAVGLYAASVALRVLAVASAINPLGLVIIALAALVTGLVIAYKKSETFRKVVDTVVGAVGAAFRWLWNTGIQPYIKFIITSFGWVLIAWGKMLRGLAKVPGFGWAKKAGDAMVNAGQKALGLADKIKKIPSKKEVRLTADTMRAWQMLHSLQRYINGMNGKTVRVAVIGSIGGISANAKGTNNYEGGPTWVGEKGPEILNLPKGSQIIPNNRTAAFMANHSSRGASSTGLANAAAHAAPQALAVINLVLDGKMIQQSLLKRKRDGGIELGLA